MAQWKVPKMLKEKSTYENVCDVIRNHYDYLKDVYLTLAVNSNYPYIKI